MKYLQSDEFFFLFEKLVIFHLIGRHYSTNNPNDIRLTTQNVKKNLYLSNVQQQLRKN